jgi:hypothetical protein
MKCSSESELKRIYRVNRWDSWQFAALFSALDSMKQFKAASGISPHGAQITRERNRLVIVEFSRAVRLALFVETATAGG